MGSLSTTLRKSCGTAVHRCGITPQIARNAYTSVGCSPDFGRYINVIDGRLVSACPVYVLAIAAGMDAARLAAGSEQGLRPEIAEALGLSGSYAFGFNGGWFGVPPRHSAANEDARQGWRDGSECHAAFAGCGSNYVG